MFATFVLRSEKGLQYFWHLVQNFAVTGNREALNFEQFFSSVDENYVATAFYFGLAESFLTLQMLSKSVNSNPTFL